MIEIKVTLEFDFDDENREDEIAHRQAIAAPQILSKIQEVDNELRNFVKWADEKKPVYRNKEVKDVFELAEEIREHLNEDMNYETLGY